MRTWSLAYQIVLDSSHLLPLGTIRLLGPRRSVPYRVLVDSGALYSVFHRTAADDAGIELTATPNQDVQYGTARVPGWRVACYLMLGERRIKADVVFVEELAFSYGLLGRVDIFPQHNEVVFLEKVRPPRVEFRW